MDKQRSGPAAMVRNERELQEGTLIRTHVVRDIIIDGVTKAVQVIRQSPMSERDKKAAILHLREIKIEPPKVVAFQPR